MASWQDYANEDEAKILTRYEIGKEKLEISRQLLEADKNAVDRIKRMCLVRQQSGGE